MKCLEILSAATFACVTVCALPAQEPFLRTRVEVQSQQSATLYAQVSGLPGSQAVFLAGRHVPAGISTPFGTLYLDPATMVVAGSATLNSNGVGEMRLPFTLSAYSGLRLGLQAVTLSPQGNLALSTGALVGVQGAVNATLHMAWSIMPQQGCISLQASGVAGAVIEIWHTNGPRLRRTRMWSGTVPNPPAVLKTPGAVYPPSWNSGESIVITVNGFPVGGIKKL